MAAALTFLRLYAVAQALFWFAWWMGYTFLPEGVLRGHTVAGMLPLERLGGVVRVAAAISGWNALAATVFVAGANLLRVRQLPLGFVSTLVWWVLYGLMLGTNSFGTPLAERSEPSLGILLSRAGIFELTAYVLVAAATAASARWSQEHWLSGPVRPLKPRPLELSERFLLVLAAALIVGGALREASQLCTRTGC